MEVNMKHVAYNNNISHIAKLNTENLFLSFIDRLGKVVCSVCRQVTGQC
jgi:hypothetical protein